MDTKIIGTQHGAAIRRKIDDVTLAVRAEAIGYGQIVAKLGQHGGRGIVHAAIGAADRFKRVGAYAAGFAQGLVRSGNG